MNEWYRFREFEATNERQVDRVKDFLDRNELVLSDDVELFVTASDDGEIVACGGISGKILKCVAVTPRLRGKRFVLKVIDELLEVAKRRGQEELFLFSTPKNQEYFEAKGFSLIEKSKDEAILMENSNNLQKYKESLMRYKKPGDNIGSIVYCDLNIEKFDKNWVYKAKERCDFLHIFLVNSNDKNNQEKCQYIRDVLKSYDEIKIHGNSEYLISKATFPTYFIKDKEHIQALHAELDLKIFKTHIAPALNITHRFIDRNGDIGEIYSNEMERIFSESLTTPPIKVVKI